MTTAYNINASLILSFLLAAKSHKPIRDQYRLNLHVITVLLACWVYSEYVSKDIVKTRLKLMIGYYSDKMISKYLSSLVSNDLLTFSGRFYSLTNQGYKTIEDISNNYDNVIYQFCNTHNIEL